MEQQRTSPATVEEFFSTEDIPSYLEDSITRCLYRFPVFLLTCGKTVSFECIAEGRCPFTRKEIGENDFGQNSEISGEVEKYMEEKSAEFLK